MDVNLGRTLSGKICKKCRDKGSRCSQHGGTPSPKYVSSTEKLKGTSSRISPGTSSKISPIKVSKSISKSIIMSENVLSDLPCDVLLKIANNVSALDYLNLSLVSKAINNCLDTGRYGRGEKKLKAIQKQFLSNLLKQIKGNPEILKEIPYLPDEIYVKILEHDIFNLKYIKNPSESVQEYVANYVLSHHIRYPEHRELGLIIGRFSENIQLRIFESIIIKNRRGNYDYKYLLEFLQFYLEENQLRVLKFVRETPAGFYIIIGIKNPSEKVQLAIVELDVPLYLEFIENPTEKVIIAALKRDVYNWTRIKNKNPSKKVKSLYNRLAFVEKNIKKKSVTGRFLLDYAK